MKEIAILILAFSCSLCEAQVSDDEKGRQCSASCCDIHSLFSLAQSLGAIGEKVANMAEKMTLLENKFQLAEKDMLELRHLIGGNAASGFMIPLFIISYC